jgi:hypothetical protein
MVTILDNKSGTNVSTLIIKTTANSSTQFANKIIFISVDTAACFGRAGS